MQFKQGASVVTADGQDVGHIDRVVLDPRTKEVTHVVVRQGFLFTQDKVVPVDLIAEGTEERVTLREKADDLPELPPFEETHYVEPGVEGTPPAYLPAYAPPLYWYPPIGAAGWGWNYPGYLGYPGGYVVETERNIPEDTIALQEGADVISADGEHIGDVERVFTDTKTNRVTHFLVTQGLLLKERKLIPITWVSRVTEEEVHLVVDSRFLEALREYQEQV